MIDLGDQVTLTYPTKPASPATVTVTITLPDGTNSGAISATSGSYVYTTTQAGLHKVLWQSTGPSDAYADAFDVTDTSTAQIISLADARAQLRVTQTTNDEELRLYLSAVTALMEHECGQIVPKSHQEIVDCNETIVLSKAPVQSITSIVPTFQATSYYAIPTFTLDGDAGILLQQPYYFAPWGFDYAGGGVYLPYYGRLTITYMAGRTTVPEALQVAARIILGELWTTRRLAGAKPVSGDPNEVQMGRDLIPDEAAILMAPYRRAPVIAA